METVEGVLAKLDEMVTRGLWPTFDGALGTFEYHAMRLVVVRERGGDDDWGLAFECVFGDFLDDLTPYAAGVSTYLVIPADPYGSREWRPLPLSVSAPGEGDRDPSSLHIEGLTVSGPSGDLACTDAMLDELDLRPGMLCGGCEGGAEDSTLVVLIRAYLARHPRAFWGDVTPLFRAPCDVLLSCEAFEHVQGPEARPPFNTLPSQSPTYRSLAEAIVSRDASRFVPGESNLDWRKWAVIPDGKAKAETR